MALKQILQGTLFAPSANATNLMYYDCSMATEAAQVSGWACLRLAVTDRDNIICISMQFKRPVAIHGLRPELNLLDISTK